MFYCSVNCALKLCLYTAQVTFYFECVYYVVVQFYPCLIIFPLFQTRYALLHPN